MSNESPFGRLMTKVGIIICANLMFILFSLHYRSGKWNPLLTGDKF